MANPRPFVAPALVPPPVRVAAPKAADDRYAGLTPETRALVEEHERNMSNFEALLAKKGLSLAKLERFAEKYLNGLSPRDRDQLRQDIAQKVAATEAPKAAAKPVTVDRSGSRARGLSAPTLARMMRV